MFRIVLVSAVLLVVVVACIGCGAKPEVAETSLPTSSGAAQLMPADGVVVIWAKHGDLERSTPRRERSGYASYPQPADGRLIPLRGISSSGMATHTGTERSPVPIAEIIAPDGRAQMTLFVILASKDDGFITRSFLAWSGDSIPGVTVAGRMHDRHTGGKGKVGEMTAQLQVGVPGRDEVGLPGRAGVAFVFVSYNAKGERIPAFGRWPFADSVRRIQERATDETQ